MPGYNACMAVQLSRKSLIVVLLLIVGASFLSWWQWRQNRLVVLGKRITLQMHDREVLELLGPPSNKSSGAFTRMDLGHASGTERGSYSQTWIDDTAIVQITFDSASHVVGTMVIELSKVSGEIPSIHWPIEKDKDKYKNPN